MTDQFNDALPQESEAQRIGRYAAKCFTANIPNAWQETDVSGGGDYGYDYQIQIIENGLAKDIFRVQLKGTSAPTLIEDGTVYSQTIKISTANFYGRATEPVLLVLCDLTVDPETPKNCPLYYAWIHDEIQRLLETSVKEDQKTLTFHVPKANELTATTDISDYIKRCRILSRLGHNLDSVVESDKPTLAAAERAEIATKIVGNLNIKSAALIDALAEDESSWVEAPAGSLHWHLREGIDALQSGRGADCERSLDEAAKLLDSTRPLERADYWNLLGRLRTFELNDEEARDAFEKACSLSGDVERHLIPWAEAELRSQFHGESKVNFSGAIARLSSEKPKIAGMRARLIAAEGRFDDAIAVTERIAGVERNIARAIIFSMQARWDETISECAAGLTHAPLRQTTKQLFLILRARSRFSKAIGPLDFGEAEEVYLPAPGPAGTDVSLLHQAWEDIAEVITALHSTGWPANVELLGDMWSATATMLGFQDQAIPLMAEAAKARPTLRTLQAGLESMAAQAGQFEIALEANNRQPESPRSLQQRIALLHAAKHHRDCVKLLEDKWDIVADGSQIFGFSLIQGIHSAKKIIRPDLEERWRSELESRPGLSAHAALFNYFETKRDKLLEADAALGTLIDKYKALDRPKLIAKHLLQELDGTNQEQAAQCLEVAETVKASSMLDLDDLTHIAQALTTLCRWNDLLALSRQGLAQFEGNDRLQAIGAIALDKLGKTAEAHELLKGLVGKADADDLALTAYIRIALRSGFADQAMTAIEKVFSGETDQAKQIECLRHMFALLQQTEPTSQRLVEIAWKIGEFVKQDDEAQEGLFLTTMVEATLPASASVSEDRRREFERRLSAFTTRFQNSRILKSITFPSDASSADLIRMLEETTGFDDQQRKNRAKLQRELNLGMAPIPYAWRPRNVLGSISDLPMLWEVSKHSSWGARHLHLTMATHEWRSMGWVRLRGQVPLLDLLSLMVLSDLELLAPLFKMFPRIAIGKATMMELQRLLAPLSGSFYRNKLLAIQATLKANFARIEQPEATPPDDGRFVNDHWESLEIIEIAKNGNYLIYSDDALFRIYSQQASICTLDLLCALDEAGEISAREAATKIAKLCSWRVGVVITDRYQLAILPDVLGRAKSISEGIAILDADEPTNALLGGIWNIEKQYGDLQGHAGLMLRKLADDTKNSIKSVTALAGFWLGKVRLHPQSPIPLDRRAALLIAQATFVEHELTGAAAHRLWSVYRDLIEDIHRNHMDDQKLSQSIRIMGEVAAESDKNHSLEGKRSLVARLASGLTEGTIDYDLFMDAYSGRAAALKRQAGQR